MKQYKWLVISLVGFLVFLMSIGSSGCNIGGTDDWRGYKAAILGIVIGIISAGSLVTLLIQVLKITQTPGAKFGGILFVFVLIFVGLVTAMSVSKQYCH